MWVAEAYGFDSPTLMGYLAATHQHRRDRRRDPQRLLPHAGCPAADRRRARQRLRRPGRSSASARRVPRSSRASTACPTPSRWPGPPRSSTSSGAACGASRSTSDGLIQLPLDKEHGAITGLGKPLKLLTRPERDSIPIYIAALGPKNVEQAAELADGWLPHLFWPEKYAEVWGEAIKAGYARRDASLGDAMEISCGGMVAIGEGPETKALLDFARPMFALYIGGMGAKGKNFYNDVACAYGYEKEATEIQDLYLSGKKDQAAALVPDEWLEAANLVGPESYVKERIAAFQEAGVTNLQVIPASDDPAATVRQLKEWVA